MKNVLMTRFGGIGDSIAITPVAKVYKKRFPQSRIQFGVRGADQVSLYKNLDCFHNVFEIHRLPDPFAGENCVKVKNGYETLNHHKTRYDFVFDFVNLVEMNSMHPYLEPMYGEWARSMNSNYQNWIDLALAWVNIDPSTVPDEDKRLLYKVEEKEKQEAVLFLSEIAGGGKTLIGLNTIASSRARSYFDLDTLINELLKEIPNSVIIAWDNNRWVAVTIGGGKEIVLNPNIRLSAAILSELDVYISTDSGFSHIAEAVGTKTVTIYSTVPGYTRNKYYAHSTTIQSNLPCSPCFTLMENCPVNRKRASQSLSDRERKILQLSNQNISPQEAAKALATTPDKVVMEHRAIQEKMNGLASVIPDCMASLQPDMIVEKVKEVLK